MFNILAGSVLTLGFVLCFAFYSKYAFQERDSIVLEEKREANKRWHIFGWLMRFCFIGELYLLAGLQVAIIVSIAVWILFDLFINIFALKRSAFYVGTTAWTDQQFQKTGNPELFNAISKVILLAIAITLVVLIK